MTKAKWNSSPRIAADSRSPRGATLLPEQARSVSPRKWEPPVGLASDSSSEDEDKLPATRLMQIAGMLDSKKIPSTSKDRLSGVSPKLRAMVREMESTSSSISLPIANLRTHTYGFNDDELKSKRGCCETTPRCRVVSAKALVSVLRQAQVGFLGAGFRGLLLARPRTSEQKLLAVVQIGGVLSRLKNFYWFCLKRGCDRTRIEIRRLMGFQIITSLVRCRRLLAKIDAFHALGNN